MTAEGRGGKEKGCGGCHAGGRFEIYI